MVGGGASSSSALRDTHYTADHRRDESLASQCSTIGMEMGGCEGRHSEEVKPLKTEVLQQAGGGQRASRTEAAAGPAAQGLLMDTRGQGRVTGCGAEEVWSRSWDKNPSTHS